MLSRIKITMAVCISLLTSTAYGHILNKKKGPYIKASSGVVLYEKLRKKSRTGIYEPRRGKTTVPLYLALGYNHNKNIATEILARFSRFRYTSSPRKGNSRDSQNMYSYSLFWNLYLKCPIRRVVPYITLGPGLAFNRSKSFTGTPSRAPVGFTMTFPGRSITSFAWNIGFGSELYSSKKILFDIGYRFVSMGAIGVKENSYRESRQVKAHDITLGLAYKF